MEPLVGAEHLQLGGSAVDVPRLCLGLGSAPPAPRTACGGQALQAALPPHQLADILVEMHGHGAIWWDTSDDYGTHAHVSVALSRLPRERVRITTKTHAASATEARASVLRSLRELGTEYVDVLLMHEIDSLQDLDGRSGALHELRRLQEEGRARAIGCSTHNIDVLEHVAGDRRLDVVMTNFNFAGVHMDASLDDYRAALCKAYAAGQGCIVMKTLGEGVLADRLQQAIRHNLEQPFLHGVVVGIKSLHEAREAVRVWRLVD